MRLTKEEIDQIRNLRISGKTIKEICDQTGRWKSTIQYWTKDLPLSEDQVNISGYRKRAGRTISGNAKKKRIALQKDGANFADSNTPLHIMGCMLYWAEGTKSGNSLTFANSDPDMIKIFLRFLRECLDVNDSEIRIRLNCYDTPFTPFSESVKFWKDITGLNDGNFTKSTIQRGSENGKHRHGICYIGVNRTKYVQHIYGAIQRYIGVDRPDFSEFGLMRKSKYR